MRKLVLFVATGAGSGYAPVAPGTMGSGVGLLLYVPLASFMPKGEPVLGGALYLLAVGGVAVLGIWASGRAESIFERRDDGRITIDEIAGMLLALAFLPFRLDVVVAGFLFFRLFDIWKPPPIRAAESLPGGLGVMADDLLAGLYANLIGQLLWRVVLPGGIG
jgi:phosphatidylglycerophosphatase A